MICRSCGSKWETGIRIQNCPFCGAPLPDESRPMNTPEDVLCEMVRQFGPGILHEEQRMLGIFADMAPHLAGPRRLLGYLVECDGPRKLIAIQNRSPEEREQCVSALVSRMQNELYVDANGARSICTSFLSAVLNSDGPHPDRKVPAREQGPAEPDQAS